MILHAATNPASPRRRLPASPAATLTALALALAAAPLAAADLTVAALRLGVGVLSREYHGSSSTTATSPLKNLTMVSMSLTIGLSLRSTLALIRHFLKFSWPGFEERSIPKHSLGVSASH